MQSRLGYEFDMGILSQRNLALPVNQVHSNIRSSLVFFTPGVLFFKDQIVFFTYIHENSQNWAYMSGPVKVTVAQKLGPRCGP